MEYRIERALRKCSLCGCRLPDSNNIWFSALKISKKGEFLRLEFCKRCFDGAEKETLFSFWKRKTRKKSTKLFFDSDGALHLLRRLITEDEHKELRYVLSLLLMRHKSLNLINIIDEDQRRYLILNDREARTYRIEECPLGKEKENDLKERLLQLFEEV